MRHYPPSELPLPANDNLFTVIDSRPYLIGDTCDQDTLLTVDRDQIQTKLIVETTDPHVSVVDIELSRLGPELVSNEDQYRRFLEVLNRTANRVNGTLEVIRPGIEVSLDYELTSERTGTLVRKAAVNLFIRNHQLYLDGSVPNPVTGPILTNFIDSTVKTITDRAYGSDRLIMTLTRLTVSYQVVKDPWSGYQPSAQPKPDLNLGNLYSVGITEQDRYLADRGYSSAGYRDDRMSGLYRFEANGKSIWLHRGEINNPMAAINRLVISTSTINKAFIIGGGHRIEMRFSIWTNDEIIVRDTSKIYRSLGNHHCHHPYPDHHHHHCDCDHDHGHHGHCDDRAMELIALEHHRNDLQECDIQYLNAQVDRLDDLSQAQSDRITTEVEELRKLITDIETNGGTVGLAPDMIALTLTAEGKLTMPERAIGDSNTAAKVTYNKFGVITGSASLSADDIPEIGTDKVTGLENRLTALEGASAYTLPTATAVVRGGITVPADNHGLAVSGNGQLTLSLATALEDGAMSHEDKALLDSLISKVAELERQVQELKQPSTP